MNRIAAIPGYENEYMISDDGMVFRIREDGLRLMKTQADKDGYFRVCLCKGNVKKTFSVHRLVAGTFIPKPKCEDAVVNHKDENKQNNDVSNLEWCTVAYNNTYNDSHLKRGAKRRKPIIAFKNGETLHFDSITEATKELGIQHSNIVMCIQGKRKTAKGYSFTLAKKG